MGKIQLDFTNVPTSEPLPRARYSIIVEDIEARSSESSEHPYLNWQLRVSEGEYQNRVLYLMTSLSPRALWRLRGIFENLGIFSEVMELDIDDESFKLLSPQLVGTAAIAVVSQEIYQGRPQNRVDDLLPMTEASLGPVVTRPAIPPVATSGAPAPAVAGSKIPAAPAQPRRLFK